MTKKLLVLTGSARPNSVGEALLPYFERAIKGHKATVLDVARVDQLGLPFYDALTSPSSESYRPEHRSVEGWAKRVQSADAVIWLMPEYNHSVTGIQKNAIDWLYKEWRDKPLGIIAYGFYAGKNALEAIQPIIGVIRPDLRAQQGLMITKDINPDGTAIDSSEVLSRVKLVVDAVLA